MNVDFILNLTIKAIEANMPEALFDGLLVNLARVFDPRKSEYTSTTEQTTPAKFIFDSIEEDIRSGSTFKATTVKLIIIANNIKTIDFYDYIQIGLDKYQIRQKINTNVGETTALFTIYAEKL